MPSQPYEVLLRVSWPLVLAAGIGLVFLGLIGWRLMRQSHASSQPSPRELPPWLPALLETFPSAALLVDAQTRVICANLPARARVGKDRNPLELPQPIIALVRRTALSGKPEGPEIHRLSGHPVWVKTTALHGMGLTLVVLSEHPDHEAAHLRQQLMQTLAHELRTPLTAILGHTEILGSCTFAEEALWQRSQQFIAAEVERLARLVEDLLTFSRLDLIAPRLTPVNLRAVAEEAISAAWQSAEEKGVVLSLQASDRLPRVLGDADQLRQVFGNLLNNGLKYTPSGGRVSVRLEQETEGVRVEIRDTGIGISENDLPHLFEPFFRSEQARRTAPGTGLGLTIVRTILLHHGVELQIAQRDGETSFSFSLPPAR